MSSPAPAEPARAPWRAFAIGAVVVVAIVVAFVLLRGGGEDTGTGTVSVAATGTTGPATPKGASPAQLGALSKRLDRPLYWVGPRPGTTYELTETADGQLYVRYLPSGVKVGDERPNFLTVGTYPEKQALATVKQAAGRNGAQSEELDDGGLAVANRSRPNSWYVAYPDGGELVEVFSPQAGRARALVRSGRVAPVPR